VSGKSNKFSFFGNLHRVQHDSAGENGGRDFCAGQEFDTIGINPASSGEYGYYRSDFGSSGKCRLKTYPGRRPVGCGVS
jgi:hypothetical protein